MADVAARAMTKTKVHFNRITAASTSDGTDTKLTISDLDPTKANLTVTEEIKLLTTELGDGTEVEEVVARKVTFEFTYDELDTTDLTAMNDGSILDLEFETATGGANSTGVIILLDGADSIYGYADGGKTHIIGKKTVSGQATSPYTITDNAA